MNSNSAKVTIAIPTYNRAELLAQSLRSALDQDYADIDIIVLDNASGDDTAAVVRSLSDSRLRYIRHQRNIGLFGNFRYALLHCTTPYLVILQDDDLLYPSFIASCLQALQKNPAAAMAVSKVQAFDLKNKNVALPEDDSPGGTIKGVDYLHSMVDGRNWVIHMSAVLMRKECVDAVGGYDNIHSAYNIDLNLYIRMAAVYDITFVASTLAAIRVHDGQETSRQFRTGRGLGQLVTLADRMDAAALLMKSCRASCEHYRAWLADRILHLNARRSALSCELVPDLNLSQNQLLDMIVEELLRVIPEGCSFVFVDQAIWIDQLPPQLCAVPFPEHQRVYNGLPADDDSAIAELNRLTATGIRYLVFVQTTFWWLDYYSGLRRFIEKNSVCRIHNSRLMIVELIVQAKTQI